MGFLSGNLKFCYSFEGLTTGRLVLSEAGAKPKPVAR
jgi:hypothetical protein